jgi:hypothetical protein
LGPVALVDEIVGFVVVGSGWLVVSFVVIALALFIALL